jgi:hypothetical protein
MSQTRDEMVKEIERRARWILKHLGRPLKSNDFFREAAIDEWRIKDYLEHVMIYRIRNRDGQQQLEWSSRWGRKNEGVRPNHDELQRMLNSFRRAMILEDLADATNP